MGVQPLKTFSYNTSPMSSDTSSANVPAMESTPGKWNEVMGDFLGELIMAFPEEKKLKLIKETFETLASQNVRKPMELFVEKLTPYDALVNNKDPALFAQPIELPGGLDMSTLWPQMSEPSKEGIWQYIMYLYQVGKAVSVLRMLSPQLLEMVDSLASKCAAHVQNNGEQLDLNSLMSSMMSSGLPDMMFSNPGALGGLDIFGTNRIRRRATIEAPKRAPRSNHRSTHPENN